MVGKRVRNALYVHRNAVKALTPERQTAVEQASGRLPDAAWNVARIEPGRIGLLTYEPFDVAAFPALLEAWSVELLTAKVSHRSYAAAVNPLILHRKELLVLPETPGRAVWAELTGALLTRGLFREPHLIGRRAAWDARLAAAGVRVEGHLLCPI